MRTTIPNLKFFKNYWNEILFFSPDCHDPTSDGFRIVFKDRGPLFKGLKI